MKTLRLAGCVSLLVCLAMMAPSHAEVFTMTTPAGAVGQAPPLLTTGDGTNNGARFKSPAGLTVNSTTNIFITDANALRLIAPAGTNWVVTTIAGDAALHSLTDGTNTVARFDAPQGLGLDSGGGLYVADNNNHAIRQVVTQGTNWVVTTVAGNGRFSAGSDDGTNSAAKFNHPYGIAVDSSTNLYIADTYNHTIRKVTRVGTNWVTTTIAGAALTNGVTDGTNSTARFNGPTSIVVDGTGNLYVTDTYNHTIRKISPVGTNWVVTTLAGLGGTPGSIDGTNSTARFNQPLGITLAAGGNLYVTEAVNNTIRKLRPSGTNWISSTVAGLAGATGSADGIGKAARFNAPLGIGIDTAGALYVADSMNNTLRRGQLAVLLNANLAGGSVILSWPVGAAGYVAQTNALWPAGTWNTLTNPVGVSGDDFVVTNAPAGARNFFRLRKP